MSQSSPGTTSSSCTVAERDAKRRYAAPMMRIRDVPTEMDDAGQMAQADDDRQSSTGSSERRLGYRVRSGTAQRAGRRSTSGSRERRVPPPPLQAQQIRGLLRRHRDGFPAETAGGSGAPSGGSRGGTSGGAASTGPRRRAADEGRTSGGAASTGPRRRVSGDVGTGAGGG